MKLFAAPLLLLAFSAVHAAVEEEGYSKGSGNERAYIPVIGIFVVLGMYVAGYYVVTHKSQPTINT